MMIVFLPGFPSAIGYKAPLYRVKMPSLAAIGYKAPLCRIDPNKNFVEVKMPKRKHTDVVKEKYGKDRERFVLKEKKKPQPEQPNLFGDQDFVFSTIQEEISGIHSMIERTMESIDKKKEFLEDLKRRKQQLDKAAAIVRKAKMLAKKKK